MADEIKALNKSINTLFNSLVVEIKTITKTIKEAKCLSEEEKKLSEYDLPENTEKLENNQKFIDQFNEELIDFTNAYCDEKEKEFVLENDELKEVWAQLSTEERQKVADRLRAEGQTELADYFQDNLVIFDDIILMPNSVIQDFLHDENINQLLVYALKDNFIINYNNRLPQIKEKLFANMSKRAEYILQEDIEFIGPVLYKDIIKARKDICKLLEKYIN